jgi:ankyrin repeat protein
MTAGSNLLRMAADGEAVVLRAIDRAHREEFGFVDQAGRSLMHYFAAGGMTRVCEELVKEGVPIEARDATGTTPLKLAQLRGHAKTITALMKLGAKADLILDDDFNDPSDHESLLADELVSASPRQDIIKALAEGGSSLEHALSLCAYRGHASACRAVVTMGAQQLSRALLMAAMEDHAEACGTLLELGADPNALNQFAGSPSLPSLSTSIRAVVSAWQARQCAAEPVSPHLNIGSPR